MASAVVLVAALVGATAAYFFTRSMWSKRTALDFILNYEVHDREWVRSRNTALAVLRQWRSSNSCFQMATAWSSGTLCQDDADDLAHVLTWLNHLEVVSIGITNNSLHRGTYMSWMGADELRFLWRVAEPLVVELRGTPRGSEDLYIWFQFLAAPESVSKPGRTAIQIIKVDVPPSP